MAVRKGHDPIELPSIYSEPIIIERRIRIAEVAPDAKGVHSMLGAAYLAIGNYMAENDDEPGYDVSFEWGGRSFRAQLEPSKAWIEQRNHAEMDEEDPSWR